MPLQDRADAHENFELIKTWLAKCATHPACNKRLEALNAADFHLPRRLIDVSPDGEDAAVKLVLGENIDPGGDCRYVALSHCWGNPERVPKTVAGNLIEHQRRIPVEFLSRTFQDAVVVVRKIGLRYLWIDSLCIVQGLDQELEEECSQMHLVYSRAYCTLSAQDSADGSGGLFIPRDAGTQPEGAWDDAPSGPLSTRGWAYQEHQLSPRVIHFMKPRIVWECHVCVASEDSPCLLYRAFGRMGRMSLAKWRMFDGRIHEPYGGPLFSRGHDGKDGVYMRWMEAIELYSAKKLSFEHDRLPAISGLASGVNGFIGDEYLAGHWQKDLARNLCWMPAWENNQVFTPTAAQYARQPSWSWTSYRGPIQYHFIWRDSWQLRCRFRVDYNFNLLSAKIDRSKYNRYGEVSSGSLQVKGLVAHVRVRTTCSKIFRIQWPLGTKNLVEKRGRAMMNLKSLGNSTELTGVALLDEDIGRREPAEGSIDAVCLRLQGVGRVFDDLGRGFRPLGLVLWRQDDGNFRRIGVYGDDWYPGHIITDMKDESKLGWEEATFTIV